MTIVTTFAPGANGNGTARGAISAHPGDYIDGYDELSKLGVGFYPIHRDKSPAGEGNLDSAVTLDPVKIQFWAVFRHYRSFAARIRKGSRLFVVDTENPFKHQDKLGPDGELFFHGLLEDNSITLPPCPTVRSANDGRHRYLLALKGYRIHSTVSLWPGIDILAAGSNVILPGSRAENGQYVALRSFGECPIPEAPLELIRLIRNAQRARHKRDRSRPQCLQPMPCAAPPGISRRQWWLLFRNRVFQSFWRREGKAGDATDSAYEFHLAKACFCCGLTQSQTIAVILRWWKQHGLRRCPAKLEHAIISKAWAEVAPWVNSWKQQHTADVEARAASKTSRINVTNDSDPNRRSGTANTGVNRSHAADSEGAR